MYFITQGWADVRFGFEWVNTDGTGRSGIPFKGAIQRNSDGLWLGESGWQEDYLEHDMTEPGGDLAGVYYLQIPEAYCSPSETSYLAKMVGDVEVLYQPGYFVHIELFFLITVLPSTQRLTPRGSS